jgi:hypothetical protein
MQASSEQKSGIPTAWWVSTHWTERIKPDKGTIRFISYRLLYILLDSTGCSEIPKTSSIGWMCIGRFLDWDDDVKCSLCLRWDFGRRITEGWEAWAVWVPVFDAAMWLVKNRGQHTLPHINLLLKLWEDFSNVLTYGGWFRELTHWDFYIHPGQ